MSEPQLTAAGLKGAGSDPSDSFVCYFQRTLDLEWRETKWNYISDLNVCRHVVFKWQLSETVIFLDILFVFLNDPLYLFFSNHSYSVRSSQSCLFVQHKGCRFKPLEAFVLWLEVWKMQRLIRQLWDILQFSPKSIWSKQIIVGLHGDAVVGALALQQEGPG